MTISEVGYLVTLSDLQDKNLDLVPRQIHIFSKLYEPS